MAIMRIHKFRPAVVISLLFLALLSTFLSSNATAALNPARVPNGPTWEDRVVAAVIAGEARGEGKKGMLAIAEVIDNRASRTGRSRLAIATAHGTVGTTRIHSFSCLNHTTPAKLVQKMEQEEGWDYALAVATKHEYPGITQGATYFLEHRLIAQHRAPAWARGKQPITTIGHHHFYLLAFR